MLQVNTNAKKFETSTIIKIGILSSISFIIMFFEFPLVAFFPEFLKLDLSDIPAIIGTFSMGPLAGFMIELIKNLLHLFLASKTGGIGEVANLLVGSAYVVPLGIMYNKVRGKKVFILSFIIASISMIFFASLLNYYIFVPAYSKFYGAPIEYFVEVASKINNSVVDLKTYIYFAVVPFNLVKSIIISIFAYVLYKILKPIL